MIFIDMTKIHLIRENLMDQIAKLLALHQIKKELPKAMKELDGDPEIQASLQSIEFHVDNLNRQLKYLCKRNPDHPKCKEKSRSK